MQVKLFWKYDPLGPRKTFSGVYLQKNAQIMEDEINAWLKDRPKIKIVEVRQSASGQSYHPGLWLVSVWYEEDA